MFNLAIPDFSKIIGLPQTEAASWSESDLDFREVPLDRGRSVRGVRLSVLCAVCNDPTDWTYLRCNWHVEHNFGLRVAPSVHLESLGIRGLGLFFCGTKRCRQDTMMCAYGGELLTAQEHSARYGIEPALYSCQAATPDLIQDCISARGLGSYINDFVNVDQLIARSGGDDHTFRQLYEAATDGRRADTMQNVAFYAEPGYENGETVTVATKDVTVGDELLVDYGWEYWSSVMRQRIRLASRSS